MDGTRSECGHTPTQRCYSYILFLFVKGYIEAYSDPGALVQESFVQECELLVEDETSNEFIIEGQYVSEQTMLEEWGWLELLGKQK